MKKLILSVLVVLAAAINVFAFEAKVIGISDGDTIKVLLFDKQQMSLRLYGVDSPESGQDYGKKAKEFTSNAVFGKTVEVQDMGDGKFGRRAAIVSINGTVLNEELLKNGFAWHYEDYCKIPASATWAQYAAKAKEQGLGLWAGKNPLEPWKFRKGELPSGTEMSYSVNIKTNTVHRTGCRYYECKDCNLKSVYVDDYKKDPKYKPCGVCKPY